MSIKDDNRIDTLQPYKVNHRGKLEPNKEYHKHYGKPKDISMEEYGGRQEAFLDEREAKKNHQSGKVVYYT